MRNPKLCVAALASLLAVGAARAQEPGRGVLLPNDETEAYLRSLQVGGRAPLRTWSLRPFGASEVVALAAADSGHPWAARFRADADSARRRVGVIPARVRLGYNTTHAFGSNDGAVWAGRGLTVAAEGGVYARLGPLSVDLAPLAFWTQNADFETFPGVSPYTNPLRGERIDLPQRFGSGAYARVDPGRSTVRLDLGPVALGGSTSPQAWGPGAESPMILGQNAAGFMHLFLGTARPVDVGVGRVHARTVYGDLRQSAYSPVTDERSRRAGAGMVLSFSPAPLPGLEVGVASFTHTAWPEGGPTLGDALSPLRGLFFSGREQAEDGTSDPLGAGNQLVSGFGRWVLPRAGLEVFGEFLRDDRAFDVRNLILEPDHSAAYMLGARKVWARSDASWWVARGEVASTQLSHLDLTDERPVVYPHFVFRQGHTHRGQLLGGADSYGGSAARLAVDRYHPGGRYTLSLARVLRGDPANFPDARDSAPDVEQIVGVEALRFAGRLDLTLGVTGAWGMNRDFRGDAFNLNLVLGARAARW